MKVIMKMKWNGITPDKYENVKGIVKWDQNPPKGLLLHAAGFNHAALHITDIWESEEDLDNFMHDRLMPGVAKTTHIGGPPEVEVFPAHSLYSPLLKS
jgi:hypothetical protein